MTIATADMKRYKREWHAQRRAEFFADKVCAWCGSTHRMELHHLDKSTKEAHCIWSWSEERRKAEIAKCIVLCLKCHRHHHASQKRKPLVHGTYNGYYSYGCRCALCRGRNTEAQRIRRAKRRALAQGLVPQL